jgi:hypothetical protein
VLCPNSPAVFPFAQKTIILGQLRGDALEQVDVHTKMPTKVVLGKCRIFVEIYPHQLVVAFDTFPPQLLSTINRTTALPLFIGSPSQYHRDVLLYLNSKFFVGRIV